MALPPELISNIANFVDPASIVPFACSYRFLADCSRDVLKAHKTAHAQYRIVSDVDPKTLPGLLRKALVEPNTAWHVRELEYCCGRKTWGRWQWPFQFNVEEGGRMRGMPPPPKYAFTQDERAVFLDLLRTTFHFSEVDIDCARRDLEAGNDSPLKLLVLALCPNVRSLKFTRHLDTNGRDAFGPDPAPDGRGRSPRSSLDYIQHAILLHLEQNQLSWPPGFSSLTDLTVGVETGTEIDELALQAEPHLFADLMHLPNLTSVYFHGLDQDIGQIIADDHDDLLPPYNVEDGSSSIQHIFLDRASGLSTKFRKAMIGGCKALKSMAITNSEMDDIDNLVGDATDHKSFETLMFYETRSLHGYRCNMFRPEGLDTSKSLRMIYIDWSDIMLDAFYNYKGDVQGGYHEWIADKDFFTKFFINDSFPESMEVLVLGTMTDTRMSEDDAEFYDHAITTMIETMHEPEETEKDDEELDKNSDISSKGFERRFPNLKAVYLGALEDGDPPRYVNVPPPPIRQKRWFSNAIAAGRKAGVDVHTRTTRGESLHQIKFPTPPSLMDFNSLPDSPPPGTSSIFWNVPERPAPGSLVFDVYTGKWGPPGCGNCGRCERCLQLYDPCVWEVVDREYGQMDA